MTRAMLAKEQELGKPLATVLRHLYYEDDLSLTEVGEQLGISHTTVWFWMRRLQIPSKRLRPPDRDKVS